MQNLQKEYLKKEKTIRQDRIINDTIYKHIEYTKIEDKILQTKILNRLQFITQNALAYFSFPSITTKRFIHSVGTMHLSAQMFKNSLLNAKSSTKNNFLKALHISFKEVINENSLEIKSSATTFFDDKALYQYTIPTKNTVHQKTYTIALQTVRIVGLLHDIGHAPFSHQIEYAMKKLYLGLKEKNSLNEKEEDFINFYDKITSYSKEVLHEASGLEFIKILFEYELENNEMIKADREYLKLIYKLVLLTFQEKKVGGFDYKVLHKFVDSTVDADRLDYINRDMLASGYIGGPTDYVRIAKQAVLVEHKNSFKNCFNDISLIDIEHMLEMRFNLYKKVIFNHNIAKKDALLENVVLYSSRRFLSEKSNKEKIESISMLWKYLDEDSVEKKLDNISILDENWLISLFKAEYFKIKAKKSLTKDDKKYMHSFEEVLFGQKFFSSSWKNLNELYKILDFDLVERYKFRESFGFITEHKLKLLYKALDNFCQRWEEKKEDTFFAYQIVSFNIGIDKNFYLADNNNLILLDEVSTLRQRLKKSMSNTVPFFIYTNKSKLNQKMKKELKALLFEIFVEN